MLHGDGEPLLIYYEDNMVRFCYTVMKQDIADCKGFQGQLESKKYYDFETPYGYGGPLCDVPVIPDLSQKNFLCELKEYCAKESVISQFIRFHPVLDNHSLLLGVIETRYLRDTIYIDTSSSELIMANMDSKNRNMVRKAIKNGVVIVQKPINEYDDFFSMYRETMEKNQAEEYYLFKRDYFASLEVMKNHACLFYAMLGDVPIGGAVMLYNDKFMNYHLAGTHIKFRQYSPSNLLLYQAGCWASEHGITKLHLGGGMSPDDSLFGFKKQFNKYGRLPFTVGRTIFDRKKYNDLCHLRKKINPDFDENNNFMIQYRR